MTTDIPAIPSIDFDHHSEHYARHWREINEQNRAACPVAHTDAHGGFWVLSSYEDIATVAKDDAAFSSYQELDDGTHTGATIPAGPIRQVPIEMDPPEFTAYRRLLNRSFAPAVIAEWEDYIRSATTYCIDQVIDSGTCDLVADVLNPVPAITTLSVLGLPTEDWRSFSDTIHEMVHTPPDPDGNFAADDAAQRLMELFVTVTETISARRQNPTDDLISTLVHAEIDGEPMSDQRLLEIISLVIFGGVDTTGSLLSSVLRWLEANPHERERLAADPGLIPQATEEFLRFFSPVQGLARTATHDCVIGDQQIRKGERLFLSWASANFDPALFPDADQVELDRFPNRHQSFGIGVHRCLGSNLARLEFRVVLEEILRRMPDFHISDDAEPFRSIGVVNGWVNLPTTFTAGVREGSDVGGNPALTL
ncbi:cytochrome P450 [Gordonia insulae]|uniref:Steroid C26-monooxygenase n=1 Tax=Gordonia insulae TaxID=2420509 RepID=A0A3G8JK04_9ACTN|nr:cytochrome P450 [Gordonia insulae]AZG45417.1 Steroid C26-monooxygenase [Gordonia insulae]